MEPFAANRPGRLLRVEPVDAREQAGARIEAAFLHLEDDRGRPCAVYAARAVPAASAPLPGVVHCPGGTQTASAIDLAWWARQGFAAASFDWELHGAGHDPARKSCWPAGTRHQNDAHDDPDACVLPLALRAVGAVLDWLADDPRVDGERLACAGISWGGYLAWMAGAYEPRLRALVPVYGCGGLFAGDHPLRPPAGGALAERWARDWDPLAIADRIRAPLCLLSGANDFFGLHHHAEVALARVAGWKRRAFVANANHHLTHEESALAIAVLRQHLLGGPALPDEPTLDADLALRVDAPARVVGADWWWTPSDAGDEFACWWPGRATAAARRAFVRVRYAEGFALATPVVDLAARDGTPLPARWSDGIAGWGSQWDMAITQLHRQELTRADLGNGRALWRVARSGAGGIDIVLRQLADPRFARATRDGLVLELALPPPAPASVNVAATLRAPGPRRATHAAELPLEPAGERLRLVIAPDALGLPQGATWREVGQLRITGRIAGSWCEVGPLAWC